MVSFNQYQQTEEKKKEFMKTTLSNFPNLHTQNKEKSSITIFLNQQLRTVIKIQRNIIGRTTSPILSAECSTVRKKLII